MKYLFILILSLFLHLQGYAQQQKISYSAAGIPVSKVLEELSKQYGIRFAFDATALDRITTSFSATNQPLQKLLEIMEKKNNLQFRLVDGTYVVTQRKTNSSRTEIAVVEPTRLTLRPVTGFVSDIVTGEPLAYCNIVLPGNTGSITNELGYFSFNIPEDSVRFFISHLGYHRLDTFIMSHSLAPIKIRLKPFSVMMKEVNVVMKEKNVLEISEASGKIGFNPAQSGTIPRVAGDDLANMLTLIPGISFLGGSTGGLSVRGSDPSENLVLLDGIPLLETGHLFGNLSMLNAGFIRQAFVSRGGFDAGFGDRASGLIELTGKTGSRSGPTMETSASLLNGNLLATVPLSKYISLSGAWRKSYVDRWPNYLFTKLLDDSRFSSIEGEETDVIPTVRYQDINLKASIHPSAQQEITLSFIRGDDQQMLDYEVGDERQLYRNEWAREYNTGWSANWSYQSGNWNHQLTTGFNDLRFSQEEESGSQEPVTTPENKGKGSTKNPKKIKPVNPNRSKYELDSDSNRVMEFRSQWKSELKKGIFTHQMGAGLVNNYFSYQFKTLTSDKNIPVDSLQNYSDQYIGHLFFQEGIQPLKWLKLRLGIRANYNNYTKSFYWQPRGGIEFIPLPDLKIYYNAGIYNQFLTKVPRIDINRNIDQVWFLPDISGNGLLTSNHQVGGFQFNKEGFLLNAELYLKQTEGRQWLYAELYRKGTESRIHYVTRNGRERNRGLDLFAQYHHHIFNHQLSWSFAKSEEQLSGLNNGGWFPSLTDHRHTLQLVEICSYKGWAASASWIFRTGQPRLLPDDTSGLLQFERLGYFSQLDASLSKNVRFRHFGLFGGISLLNILNRTNVIRVDYLNISTDSGSYSGQSSVSTLSFTPVFFFRLQVF